MTAYEISRRQASRTVDRAMSDPYVPNGVLVMPISARNAFAHIHSSNLIRGWMAAKSQTAVLTVQIPVIRRYLRELIVGGGQPFFCLESSYD